MKKSDDFENVDYRNIPKEIQDVVSDRPEIIIKKAKLTFDGKQFIVRIPTEISKLMGISSEHMVEFRATIPTPRSQDERKLEIRIVKE